MRAKAGVGALGLVLLALLVFMALSAWGRRPAAAVAAPQPINFPHNVHVQTYKIDCQYCHSDARRSEYAGLPVGLALHGVPPDHRGRSTGDQEARRILGQEAADSRGRASSRSPSSPTFPHKPHVRAGVACQTCHGPVQEMTTVAATTGPRLSNDLLNLVGLRPPAPPLTMGWCVDCHRQENATRGAKAPLDCIACHH